MGYDDGEDQTTYEIWITPKEEHPIYPINEQQLDELIESVDTQEYLNQIALGDF